MLMVWRMLCDIGGVKNTCRAVQPFQRPRLLPPCGPGAQQTWGFQMDFKDFAKVSDISMDVAIYIHSPSLSSSKIRGMFAGFPRFWGQIQYFLANPSIPLPSPGSQAIKGRTLAALPEIWIYLRHTGNHQGKLIFWLQIIELQWKPTRFSFEFVSALGRYCLLLLLLLLHCLLELDSTCVDV